MTGPLRFKICYSDTNASGKASPQNLMRYMVETSITQSLELEKDTSKSIVWMLHRWDVEFKSYPDPGQIIQVETYPVDFHKFYAYRDFIITCEEREIVRAKSIWVAVSKETGRLVKIPQEYQDVYDVRPSQFMLPTYGEDSLQEAESSIDFKVRQSDIDSNQHVNNLEYIQWILEGITREYQSMHRLTNLTVIYRKEVHYPGTVRVLCQQSENEFFHEIVEIESNERKAFATTVWREK